MLWFKHMVGARRDPKIQNVIKWHGPLGYARWWRILEIIAEDMNESDRCGVTLDARIWKNELWFHHTKQLGIYLESLAELGLISFRTLSNLPSISGQSIEILCPNLLKIRARRSAIASTRCALDRDIDREIDKEPPISPLRGITPNGVDSDFEAFWKSYPRKIAKAAARLKYRKARKKTDAQAILTGLQRAIASWAGKEPEYIPHAATWLNQERWLDDPSATKTQSQLWVERMEQEEKANG